MSNRRSFPRYRGRVRVQYGPPGESQRVAFTGDVGPTGVHVLTGSPVRPGDDVQLELTLPDGSVVKVKGIVRWAKKAPHRLARLGHAGFGVEFADAPEHWYSYCFDMQRKSELVAARGQAEDDDGGGCPGDAGGGDGSEASSSG